jgi:hypothetical protein
MRIMPPTSPSLARKDASRAMPLRQTFLTVARFAIGIGLLAYLAKSGLIDFRSLPRLFTAWRISLAAVALLLLDVVLMAFRLCGLFRPLGLHIPLGRSLQLTLVSFFLSTFLPGAAGSDIARLYYVSRGNSGRRTEIVTVVLLDRAIGLFSLLILPLLFAPMFLHLIGAVSALRILLITLALLGSGLLGGFLIVLFNQPLMNWLVRVVVRRPRWNRFATLVLGTIAAYRKNPGTLVAALLASFAANLSLVAVTALAVLALNPTSVEAKMCLVIPIGHVVNSLPLTPGGLGVGETAFNALFKITGLRGGVEALLGWRIWTVLVGILGLVAYLRGLGRLVFDAGDAHEEV